MEDGTGRDPDPAGGEVEQAGVRSSTHARVRRLLAGDERAAAWLWDRFADQLLRRLARRYGHLRGLEPEDLLQEAFAFYFQNDGKVLRDFLDRVPEGPAAERALLRHLWDLACGLATNQRRSAWERRAVAVEEVRGESPGAGAERKALARDMLGRLEKCLADGNRRVYLYFVMRFRDGRTPEEISTMTGWSRKATYKLRQALNQAVEACAEDLELGL